MLSTELTTLLVTAASIGFIHTILGPDHYLPFIGMAQARGWSMTRALVITVLCGIGHVGSSVLLGLLGVAFGTAVTSLEAIEAIRGDLAAWALIAFGLVYLVWGLRRAAKNIPHHHLPDGSHAESAHGHQPRTKKTITPWVLFTIFVLGPCEPLIPLLMYPAAQHSTSGMLMVTGVFAVTTIGTMTITVALLVRGLKAAPLQHLERYSHALAGLVLALCGAAIQFGL